MVPLECVCLMDSLFPSLNFHRELLDFLTEIYTYILSSWAAAIGIPALYSLEKTT